MTIEDHLLKGDNVDHQHRTTKTSGKFATGQPDAVLVHYTAGRDALSSVKTLLNPKVKASAHLVIGRDGKIYQLAPFDEITWHAGASSWQGRNGMNKYCIGIEIDNAGRLDKQGEEYLSWFGKAYPPGEVFEGVHRNERKPTYWHRYTEQQIELVEELCELFLETYPITQILGHEEVSPGRKSDPGPAFPLDVLRDHLLNADRHEESDPGEVLIPREKNSETRGIITASKLNIREKPGIESLTVADPLGKGTLVKILKQENGWYKVQAEIEGWVSGQWIST